MFQDIQLLGRVVLNNKRKFGVNVNLDAFGHEKLQIMGDNKKNQLLT